MKIDEHFTKEITHEIANPVNFAFSSISILRQGFEEINKMILLYQRNKDKFDEKTKGEIDQLENEIQFELLSLEIKEAIQTLEDSFERIMNIVHSMTDGVRKASLDINECLENTISLVKSNVHERVKIIKKYGKIPRINSYKGTLDQVFLNIIINAMQAIEEKGIGHGEETIIVETETSGKYVVIKISDTGKGMSAQTKKKLFQPQYSTKDKKMNAGIGMFVVHKIISDHQGDISIRSAPGKGSEITLKIPF